MLILPLVISIAMFENSTSAILFGAFAGLITDMYSISKDGFYAVVFAVAAFAVSSLVLFKFKRKLKVALIFSLFWCIVYNLLYWILFIGIKGYEGASALIFSKYIASAVYTWLFTPLCYGIIKFICRKTETKAEGEWSV